MKKGTKIRNVFTDEMMGVIRNKELTDAQVGSIIRNIVYPGEFDSSDCMAKVFARSFYGDYLDLTLSCAESKRKELERLNKHYSNPKNKCPAWFPKHYETFSKYYDNVIETLVNVINNLNNTSFDFSIVSKVLDNVPITFAIGIVTNTNTNTKDNTNTNTNDTETVDSSIPPKSPEGGLEGAGDDHLPPSILDDPKKVAGAPTGAPDEEGDPTVESIAAEVERDYPYRINPGKLRKCLTSVRKKNAAADVLAGYRKWLAVWKRDNFRWAPNRISDFFYDGKFAEEPRLGSGQLKQASDPDTVSTTASLDLV